MISTIIMKTGAPAHTTDILIQQRKQELPITITTTTTTATTITTLCHYHKMIKIWSSLTAASTGRLSSIIVTTRHLMSWLKNLLLR